MRFKQQIRRYSAIATLTAVFAGVSASGRVVSASEQAQPATPGQPPTAVPGTVLAVGVDEAVRLALQNNLGIEAERLGPQVAAFGIAQAQAAYVPTLFSITTTSNSATPPSNFLTGTGRVINDSGFRTTNGIQQFVPWGGGRYQMSFVGSRSTTTGFTNFNPAIRSNFDASYTQPFLRNFKIDTIRQQLMLSRNLAQIADLDLRQRVTQVSRNVRNSYYNLVGALAGLQVAQQSLDLAREQLKNNQRRVEVGVMASIDILEAEAEVARVEETVIVAETQIHSAQDSLRALVLNPGRSDFWTTRLEPAEQPSLAPRAINVEEAVTTALANRTDLAALRKSMEATDINVAYLKNQKLPELNLQANYGMVGLAGTQFQFGEGFPPPILNETQRSFTDALRDVFGNNFRSWSLQVNVSYPIGTTAADAALASTRLQKQQQQVSLRDAELQITTQVREAARQVTTSLQRVESTRKAAQLAEQRLQAERKRLEVGLSDTFRVFQVQRDLAGARRAELQAVIDYNRALVNFEAVQFAPIGF